MNQFSLCYPLPLDQVTQRFALNANASYSEDGLKGHTAWDWAGTYGAPLYSCSEGYVYSVLNRNNPDPERYRAVYVLFDTGEVVYEISYGHLNEIFAKVGDKVTPGDVLGTIGNTGAVYAGGRKVTKQERLNGSKAGTHLHGPQVRACKKTKQTLAAKT